MKTVQNKVRIYKISNIDEINKILEVWKKEYPIHEQRLLKGTVFIYDTFDWRLYKSQLKLLLSNNIFILSRLFDNTPLVTEETTVQKTVIRFFTESPLLQEISPLITIRALIRHASVNMKTRKFNIGPDNQAPLLYFEVIELFPVAGNTRLLSENVFLVMTHPGDVKDVAAPVISALKNVCVHTNVKQDLFFHMLSLYTIKPGSYSPKINIKLLPHMTTETTCRIILSSLLHTMQQNEEGIINDIDPEIFI